MFKIRDGRGQFYQWDLNREIEVLDESIKEVHFCNKTDECSLVVAVQEDEAIRYVHVPNIILQESLPIRVYGYKDGYTLVEEVFKVKARTRPSDYVYTETDILRYSDLAARIDALEGDIDAAVKDYLDKNPIQMDGYATEEYVDNKIDLIEVPTKVSQLENDEGYLKEHQSLEGYATEQYVQDALKDADIDVDLTDYYTKTETDQKLAEIDVDVAVSITDDGEGNVTIETTEPVSDVIYSDDTSISIETAEEKTYIFNQAINAISALKGTSVNGISVQFQTGDTIANNEVSAIWKGDDCADNIFTPAANTSYEVVSYYNAVTSNTINMVMKV